MCGHARHILARGLWSNTFNLCRNWPLVVCRNDDVITAVKMAASELRLHLGEKDAKSGEESRCWLDDCMRADIVQLVR